MADIVIAGAARTPVGAFNGGLASLPAHKLGEVAIVEALRRAEVEPKEVSEVIMGQILAAGEGQNPARQAAIGAGLGDDYDVAKARYDKVIILADADVDGSHIRTLLLTFFFRQMRPLVEEGHVYVAQPPLFSTSVGKEKVYLKDEQARQRFLAEKPNHKGEFNRLKGLGEMDWNELGETTMDPSRRTLLRIDVEQAALADEVCSILMGDDVELRKHFITTNAGDVRFLDI